MSLHRQNITWERPDGSWAIGFYDYTYVNQDSPDFDYEWDVEYLSTFSHVYVGVTPEEAMSKYTQGNANPGGTTVLDNTPENQATINELEKQYAAWKNSVNLDQW